MENQQKRGRIAPPSKRSVRMVGLAVGTVILAALTFWIVSIAPLVSVSVQKAYVLHEIGVSKRHFDALEAATKKEEARHGELQAQRAELEAKEIELTNQGVKNTLPVKTAAFQPAGK
jgi:hypothetical protein